MLAWLNIIAAIATIISFSLYLWEKLKSDKRKRLHDSSIRILRERIRSLTSSIKATSTNADLLVQISKSSSIHKEQTTNLARMLRTELYAALRQLNGVEENLHEWKYGELLESIMEDNNDSIH